MGVHDIVIDKNNRVITSEIFPGRVQVFRYVTDAEAEAEKKLREGGGETKPAAPAQKAANEAAASTTAKDSAAK